MHLAVRCGFLRSGDDGEFRNHDSVVKCYVVPSPIDSFRRSGHPHRCAEWLKQSRSGNALRSRERIRFHTNPPESWWRVLIRGSVSMLSRAEQ